MKCDLYCYAMKNNKIKLNDEKKLKNYKEKYKNWLNLLLEDKNIPFDKILDQGPSYVDPDMSSKDADNQRENPVFYADLCTFLNHPYNTKKYTFDNNDEFIHGNFIYDNEKVKVELVSDQFGFSAPSNKKNHPYDLYLERSSNRDEAIDKVINWVMESRTIGGSFLWPKDIWNTYNMIRGGSKSHKGGSYIQDRVDLTLLEIKHYLDETDTKDCLKLEKNSPSEKWLKSFKTFKNYVKYFDFDSFVDKDNDYMPYDIVRSNMREGIKICLDEKINYKNLKENSIYNLSPNKLEIMFNNVNFMIKKRSKLMESKINDNK